MRSRRFALLAILLCTSAAARAFAAASLTPLGDLPGGGVYSRANGVSGDGSVVVGYSSSDSGKEAFRWTSDGGMVGLGHLPGGGFDSEAYGVSGDGSVIVGGGISASGYEAFRWTSDGGMMGLDKLPGAVNSGAYGVSGDGSVVVGASDRDVFRDGGEEAFRWTSDGGMIGLGHLPGAIGSGANGVSADGSVIVGYNTPAPGSLEAFRWTSDGGMVGLGALPGAVRSVAYGVSGDGSVIVGYSGNQAFRWTSDGGMVGLGKLPGAYNSVANGVSGDGSVVVGYNQLNPGVNADAFYWTADVGMRALWDLLLSHGVDPAADGWNELAQALDISADGNTIVGYGIRNDNGEAFVAVIPVVPQPGDYNGNGLVEQADLDLVLSNWGAETPPVPADWTNDLPQGPIDQTELDNVLLNWGNTSAADANASATAAVPEPSGLDLLALSAGVLILTGRRIRRGESEPEHSGQSRSGR